MKGSVRAAIADAWERTRVRFARKPETAEEPGTLRLSVSEMGWQATLELPNEPAQTTSDSWADANVPMTAVEAIRRAVRSISRAQRERIGSVRLAVSDPAIFLIDGRSARIRSTDPAVIAQLGSQELGVDAVLFAFAPFGQSSEYEVARGAYAFIAVEQVKEYLIALDTLATQLVELVPAPLLELADAEAGALAGFQLRNKAATLLLADPETGTVLCREIEFGRNDCVAAVANATSVSPREAAEGLQRRICLQAEAGWPGAPMPMTATERALAKLLGALKTELSDWLEHFVHHRLANAPARVLLSGEVDRVRGLSEWIGRSLGVAAETGVDLHHRFAAAQAAPGRNLLQSSPSGMLTIGKTEYRFVDGRFRSDQAQQARPATLKGARSSGLTFSKRVLASARERAIALSAGAALAVGAGLWLSLGGLDLPLEQASATLAATQAQDGVLRDALLRRTRSGPAAATEPGLDWFDRLGAIADALTPEIRIAKLATSGADPAIDDRLTLEGEAVAADSSLAEISATIDRLANTPAFMRDVGAITFGGAEVAENRAGDLLHFTINVSLAKAAKSGGRLASPGRR